MKNASTFGIAFMTAAMGLCSAMAPSHAQTYPSKPIRLIVPDLKQRLAHEGIELQTSTPSELGELNAEQFAKWTKVIRQAGIQRSG